MVDHVHGPMHLPPRTPPLAPQSDPPETPEQKMFRDKGMCGELLRGGAYLCCLKPGHGPHGTSDDVARAYYEANDASAYGHAQWEDLPPEAQEVYIQQTDKWAKAFESAGLELVRAQ